MVERLNGIQKVGGSIPPGSTRFNQGSRQTVVNATSPQLTIMKKYLDTDNILPIVIKGIGLIELYNSFVDKVYTLVNKQEQILYDSSFYINKITLFI